MDNKKQLIISVGREFGSGGHKIAEALAKKYDLPLYDKNLLEEIEAEKNLEPGSFCKYDEKPKRRLFYRTVKGHSNSPEENIAMHQFEYLKKKADKGDSFVIVGRCAEDVLHDYKAMISIFILGDFDVKVNRISELHNISKSKAEDIIRDKDKKRKSYHNYYCKGKWGDSRCYDFSINSSRMGIEKTVAIISDYIDMRLDDM